MPEARVVAQEVRLESLERKILGTQLIYIRITRDLYEQGEDKESAILVSSEPDIDLLIDPSDGHRLLRHELSAEGQEQFDELCLKAKEIHCPISHYAEQAPIIYDDDTKVIGVICGARAGKTHAMAMRLFRRWALRGGPFKYFWWVSPSWKQTEIGIKKIVGDGISNAVFPPELILSFPDSQHVKDQTIRLIDGTVIELWIAHLRGGNLKGFSPMDIFVDELAEIRHRENWTVMVNRLTTNDGTICAVTTPVANHWSRADIVARAQRMDDVKHVSISVFQNPWEKHSVINRLIETLGGHNDPVVRREFYGEWIATDRMLWPDWAPEKMLVQDADVWEISELVDQGYLPEGYIDVTARAASAYWPESKGADIIIGQDVNIFPCASVVLKVFGDPRRPETWGVFVCDEVLTRGNIQNHCKELIDVGYEDAPVSIDATSAQRGTHSNQGATGSSTNRLEMRRFGFNCKACNYYKGKPSNPRQIDSLALCYRLMQAGRIIVSRRCEKLIEAFENQEREQDGRISKEPGKETDKLSAPSDALRYALWPLFGSMLKNRVGRYDEEASAEIDY